MVRYLYVCLLSSLFPIAILSLSLSFFLVLWVEQKAAFSAELQSYNFRTTDAAQIEFS